MTESEIGLRHDSLLPGEPGRYELKQFPQKNLLIQLDELIREKAKSVSIPRDEVHRDDGLHVRGYDLGAIEEDPKTIEELLAFATSAGESAALLSDILVISHRIAPEIPVTPEEIHDPEYFLREFFTAAGEARTRLDRTDGHFTRGYDVSRVPSERRMRMITRATAAELTITGSDQSLVISGRRNPSPHEGMPPRSA
jgi:hypothetical protein